MYDALNVLEALDIIAKDKKSVSWRGFPDTHCSRDFLAQERATRQQRVQQKEYELVAQPVESSSYQQIFNWLVARSHAARAP